MSKLVKGIHHVALKCENAAQFAETVTFYKEVIGLELARSWGEGEDAGAMFETGAGIIEIFATGRISGETGSVNHFAFATDDPDACIEKVRTAGYKVTMEPTDITIPSTPAFPIRVAFVIGPVGEEIEFFKEC